MTKPVKRTLGIVAGIVLLIMLARACRPKPVDVDIAEVTSGPMLVSVDQDGKTRVKERYVVSAPVAGRLERIALDPGDPVVKGETVLAVIAPGDPALLDARHAIQAEARLSAAQAARAQATLQLDRARGACRLASNDLARATQLLEAGGVSRQAFDQAEFAERTADGEVEAMERALEIADFDVQQARAALDWANAETGPGKADRLVIRAPVDGGVLRVFEDSSRVVAPGTPLLELGNRVNLEIVVDVLSEEAIDIAPGARVIVEHWGGEHPLAGAVRRVEPAAFTKMSALGVEEQRVNVIVDLLDPPEQRAALGDGYRVEARIVTWETGATLKIPAGGLFRKGRNWAVFLAVRRRARLRAIKVGHMNGIEAEVLDGLSTGDRIVVNPGDTVQDGVAIRVRE